MGVEVKSFQISERTETISPADLYEPTSKVVSEMLLTEIIWKDQFVQKLEEKHHVLTDEVEDVLFTNPFVRRAEKGKVRGEDLYVAYGQTSSGRYLVVFFILKYQIAALPISARDMTRSERRYYAKR